MFARRPIPPYPFESDRWRIAVSEGHLDFQCNGSTVARLTSSNRLEVSGILRSGGWLPSGRLTERIEEINGVLRMGVGSLGSIAEKAFLDQDGNLYVPAFREDDSEISPPSGIANRIDALGNRLFFSADGSSIGAYLDHSRLVIRGGVREGVAF